MSAIAALPQKEKEMVEKLNERIKTEPTLPIPEGYIKVKEKMPVYEYKVPEEYYQVEKGEEKAICISVLDGLLSKAFGFHILEPSVSFKEVEIVRPSLPKISSKKTTYSRPSEKVGGSVDVVGIMEKADARRANEPSSRQTNRSNLPKIGYDSKPAEKKVIKPIDVEGIKEVKKLSFD